jgi:hypothetical protein
LKHTLTPYQSKPPQLHICTSKYIQAWHFKPDTKNTNKKLGKTMATQNIQIIY